MNLIVCFVVCLVIVVTSVFASEQSPAKTAQEIPAKIDAGFWPKQKIEYTLAPPFLYRPSAVGPAARETAIAWSRANELVYRTALAKDYTLPAQQSGPTRNGWCPVIFTGKDGKTKLVIEVNVQRDVLWMNGHKGQPDGAANRGQPAGSEANRTSSDFVQGDVRVTPPVQILTSAVFEDGGSKTATFRDAKGRNFWVFIDYRLGTKNPGAVYLDGAGTPEKLLITNAVALRRMLGL